ncbi:hypothetical protein LCGC14_0407480 [marine sediment metagenome]|uniref:Uncharacterized protein n=1 Tax=marine sediment metagenome TaxID=412755 RepID=A0A0F9VH12_9ZZZZ
MANERALLKYRNPDSTQDINDRLAGLLVKGIFEGGNVAPVSGVLRVTLSDFSTVGSDGMFVKQSNSQNLDIVADPLVDIKTYIVIQQQYQSNSDPTISVDALTSDVFAVTGPIGQQGADNPNMIVFATVIVPAGNTAVSSADISFFERDSIDVLGRSAFRGVLNDISELPIAGLNANRVGDYFTISDGSGGASVPSFFTWNGSAWVNSTDISALQTELDEHRGNMNESGTELHVSTEQAAALSGAGVDMPSLANRYLLEDSLLLPTADQRAALEGNGLPLEDETPNATNSYVTSTKVIATPDEVTVNSISVDGLNWVELGSAQNSDGYFVGANNDVSAAISKQWFALYSSVQEDDERYINDDFASVVVEEVRVGSAGGVGPFTAITPGDTHIDDLGFFVPNAGAGGTLYLLLSNSISAGGARTSFGRRTHWGDFPPQFMLQRGPQHAQINTEILRLLNGTINVQFSDDTKWDNVAPGQVAAWNTSGSQFVVADPNSMRMPIGVRGTANNLIQEGMLDLSTGGFPTGSQVYADKANPGSLTTLPNEWFIGTAISDTELLVNMNGIPLQASGEVTPGVIFPSDIFLGVQEGQTCAFEIASGKFVPANTQDPLKLPTGLRGTGNNVIISGLYVASSSTPFVPGLKYYADPNTPGLLTTTENDWYIGIATANDTLLVNITSVAIPHKWTQEHDPVSGHHAFSFGSEANRPSDPAAGTLFIRTDEDPNALEFWDGGSWVWIGRS